MPKPWSRVDSILQPRFAARAIDPFAGPDPDPEPPPDEDDDQIMRFVSGVDAFTSTRIGTSPNSRLAIYALGSSDPQAGPSDPCMSGLFAASDGYDKPFVRSFNTRCDGTVLPGVVPKVGRLQARRYSASGTTFETWMLAPDAESGGVGCGYIDEYLAFAWLDTSQYNALMAETAHYTGSRPSFDSDTRHHRLLKFAAAPVFTISQPFAEVTGSLDAAPMSPTGDPITWVSIRASLFGIVGMGSSGTSQAWVRSQPCHHSGGFTYSYGALPAVGHPPLRGEDVWGDPVVEVFAVGWGLYELNGELHAAVTPPLRGCVRPGVGDIKKKKGVPNGRWTGGGPVGVPCKDDDPKQQNQDKATQTKG